MLYGVSVPLPVLWNSQQAHTQLQHVTVTNHGALGIGICSLEQETLKNGRLDNKESTLFQIQTAAVKLPDVGEIGESQNTQDDRTTQP
jgi:hypothetical protein